MGLVKHRRGSIRTGGRELVRTPAHEIARGHASLVPEGRRLFLNQSVEDNLLLGALHLRRDRRRVRELLGSVYELFPLLQLRQRGRSLLLVEQRVDLALRVCDRVYVLAGGGIALEERAADIDAEERSLINAYLG